MIDKLKEDILRFSTRSDNYKRSKFYLLCLIPGLTALLAYRLGFWLKTSIYYPSRMPAVILLTPIFWLLTVYCRICYDIHLEQSAEIDQGLFIAHCGGIRIRKCRLGNNCTIHHDVYIGPSSGGNLGPVIGKNVWIGPLSKIEGKVNVGNNATIGAGTHILKDVATGNLVMGNPARVVQKCYDNSNIHHFQGDKLLSLKT